MYNGRKPVRPSVEAVHTAFIKRTRPGNGARPRWGRMAETRTLCPYCGVGCGLVATTRGGRLEAVAGDPLYPVNRGRTCRKPLELASAVHARDRATVPLLRAARDARFEPASWDGALG